MSWQEETSWKVVGSNPGASLLHIKKKNSCKIPVKVSLCDHLVLEFVPHVSVIKCDSPNSKSDRAKCIVYVDLVM